MSQANKSMFSMKQPRMFQSPRQQGGAVLIVSLLLLLIVTMLALGAGQSTRLQERLAGSQRNYDLAFQSAEAALRAGERWVESPDLKRPPTPGAAMSIAPPYKVYERGYLNTRVAYTEQAFQSYAWWLAQGQKYAGTEDVISGTGFVRLDPVFYVEEVEEVPDALSQPPTGPAPSRIFYRVVSRGTGGTDDAAVVLHSTYVRRYQ
jgi:type IV pilus assembly protein PilX